MYYSCREFYNNAIAMRKVLSEIILREHNGDIFRPEEIEKIKAEIQPVQNRIIEATEESIKQLTKQISIEFFCEDEELPF